MTTGRLTRSRAAVTEAAIVGGTLLAYFLTRGRIADRHHAAQRNAQRIIRLERRLGLYCEPALNRWTAAGVIRRRFWNAVYFWAHAPLIAMYGLWLYRRRPEVYRLTRNAVLGSAVIGLITYRFFPVAPPRLTDGETFVDTMQESSPVSYQAQTLGPFVNPYAAVPSLHFGWSFLLSLAMVLASPRSRWWQAGAVAQPLLMFGAIVATANHWVIDAVAGLAACLGGLGCALIHRHARRRA